MVKAITRARESRWLTRAFPFAILLVLVVVFSIMTGGKFTGTNNLMLMLEQALIVGTVATGAVFIFGTGNVNIAMGACTALTATLSSMMYLSTGSLPLMMMFSVLFGTALLFVCALLSTLFKVRVMFVTIVMMVLLSSIQQAIIGGSVITLPYEMTSMLKGGGFSYIVFALFFVLCGVLFHFTSVGRAIRFIGTNQECAQQTGLSKNHYLAIAFVVAGVGVGLGSLMTIVRTGSISLSTASTLNMDCMLAIVLGGMSVFGGSRSYVYAGVVGAVTVTMLNNGLLMIGVDNTVLQLVRGVVFLVLVTLGQKRPKGLPEPEG